MIEVSIYNLAGVAVLGNFISHWYTPIQATKGKLIQASSSFRHIHYVLDRVLNCSKCSSFILSLALFLDIPAAALCSLMGFIVNFLIDYIQDWYE